MQYDSNYGYKINKSTQPTLWEQCVPNFIDSRLRPTPIGHTQEPNQLPDCTPPPLSCVRQFGRVILWQNSRVRCLANNVFPGVCAQNWVSGRRRGGGSVEVLRECVMHFFPTSIRSDKHLNREKHRRYFKKYESFSFGKHTQQATLPW